jgi:hypothetical protein
MSHARVLLALPRNENMNFGNTGVRPAGQGGDAMREILIRAGKVAIRARLLETPTAERIWAALPIYGEAQMWGHEIYFRAPISSAPEPGARDVVNAGEIAFWPDGDAIAIGFGPTPVSRKGEIRMASPCNIWAMALDDVSRLKSVHAGEDIAIVEANGHAKG